MSIQNPRFTVFFIAILSAVFASAQDQDTLRADDILKMSFRDLCNTKVISVSKVQQSIKDASAMVRVITGDQIRERGYFTLEEALSDLPGFQFRNILGFNSYVFMRGAPSQNNLILLMVDGVQINELNSGGFYGGGQFNLSDIQRIEVVYGPASVLYGTNAMSGIINLITRSPGNRERGHAGLLAGGFKTGMADFRIGKGSSAGDIGALASGMVKTSEKADLDGTKGDGNWSDDMENFETDVSLSLRSRLKNLETGILYQRKRASNTTYYRSEGDVYSDRNSLWDISFLNGFARAEQGFGERLKFKSTLYYRNSTVEPNTIDRVIKATESSPGNRIGYYRPGSSAGMESQLTFTAAPRMTLVAGAALSAERLSSGFSRTESGDQDRDPPRPSSPPELTNRLFSYFVQADCRLHDTASLICGMRRDFSSYYGTVLTPRTGIVFNAERASVKLLYGEAFRAPKPWDFTYGTGNPDLEPEIMRSLELDVSCPVRNNTVLSVSVYRNRISNKLAKQREDGLDRWANDGSQNTLGAECSVDVSVRNWTVFANYTFADSRDGSRSEVPEISRHGANAGTTWRPRPGFKVNLRANYSGPRKNPTLIPGTGDDVIGGALVFNGTVSYPVLKDLEIQIKANNILNRRYFHPNNLFDGRYRQPQRSFTIKVAYDLG